MIVWTFTDAAAAALDLIALPAQGGSPSLRPYLHIFLAYAAAWILILFWVWRIWRGFRQLDSTEDG
ncbi:MAG: hypothetical protein F4106_00480 [Gemmatimonadetes bacterium]|nr:hypothetical protein [Gemmatimonadota bacterium]MXX73634.1 hypothetical protein [Gemmatimonadota bacterium]MYC92415.1 hypothetical protein [Gemmatimonadota bacterium]MYG37004.1 hypothetical protein [Gemmatimonadota bacterium]MYJ16528.1 hypothetical protein [Gemmatimonadota bacterium]